MNEQNTATTAPASGTTTSASESPAVSQPAEVVDARFAPFAPLGETEWSAVKARYTTDWKDIVAGIAAATSSAPVGML